MKRRAVWAGDWRREVIALMALLVLLVLLVFPSSFSPLGLSTAGCEAAGFGCRPLLRVEVRVDKR